MRIATLSIIAPGLLQQSWNEAEVLGSVVWLWMHSRSHCAFPLDTLPILLLPAIVHRQFILILEADTPVCYLSWAQFSLEAEKRYLAHSPLLMPKTDWRSGDRMWFLDWVAPFGHTRRMALLIKRQLLANRWGRALYHRGSERGFGIKTYQGAAVLPAQAKEWFERHPVAQPH